MTYPPNLTRRTFAGGVAAFGAVSLLGCGDGARSEAPETEPAAAPADPVSRQMVVYRDPSCGCCEKWAALASEAGYQGRVVDHPDMTAIKRQYGVPDELTSCHTAIVGGYAIEGHVPLGHVARLLAENPPGVAGIAVAGMPLGSPGMEVPDGTRDAFEVMAFDRSGKASPFMA